MSIADKAEQHGRKAAQHGKKASRSKPFRTLVMLGLIGVGVVHILIGVLALRIAWGGGGEEASKQGALQEIASVPFGEILLWVLGIVMIAVMIWKLTEAAWGHTWEEKKGKRIRKRIGSAGGAVIYGFLAFSAIQFATGGGGGDSDQENQTYVGELLSRPFGVVLVCAVAVGILVYAGIQIKRGITASFVDHLQGEPGPAMKTLGRIGYVAKGVALGVVGVLLGWAAISYDPEKAGGLDDALKTIKDQPLGPYLLSLVALGLIAYGIYCFSWSQRARHS